MQAIELIEKLGGTNSVADLCNVKPPSVSGWKENNRIPDDKLIRLAPIAESKGIVTRKVLFPNDWQDIWPELGGAKRTKKEAKTERLMVAASKTGLIERRTGPAARRIKATQSKATQ